MNPRTVDIGQFSDVVGMIYDCVVDPHLWPKAIEQVGRLIDGINGVVMIIDTVENKSTRAASTFDWNVDGAANAANSLASTASSMSDHVRL